MTTARRIPLIAVDVGNSRVKFGLFERDEPAPQASHISLPAPSRTLVVDPRTAPFGAASFDGLEAWLADAALPDFAQPRDFDWFIAGVQRQVSSQLVERLHAYGVESIKLVTSGDLPLAIKVPRPDMVGIDRLLGAVGANRLRDPARPAVVVQLGTAITVNLVAADGTFRGGAILPGIGMSARALHQFTDLLPLIDMQSLAEPPPPVGDSTVPAMTSGLYWGAVGAVKQLIELLGREAGATAANPPQVFLTGGAAPSVAELLPGDAQLIPDLVLSAIAVVAASEPRR